MSTPSTIPYLPKNIATLADKQRYADFLGIIWEFDKQISGFRQAGIIQTLPEVSHTQDGLVTATIQKLINELKAKFGVTLTTLPTFFKIGQITDVYYYLFKSSNNTITFSIEDASTLRLEINTHEILRHFIYMAKKGDRGDPGDQGDDGYDALPDEVICGEPTYSISSKYSSFTATQVNISIPVKNINGEPISLRLFNARPSEYSDNGVIISADIPASGTNDVIKWVSNDLGFKVSDKSTASYINGVLNATLVLDQGQFTNKWFFRALQRGQRGDPGESGKNFISVLDTTLNSRISYAEPVIDIRVDELSGEVRFTRLSLSDTQCVSRLTIPAIADVDTNDPYTSNMLSLEKTLNGCKRFFKWKFDKDVPESSTPELPQWTPVPGCQVPSFYNEYAFDWIGYSDLAAKNGVWASPDGTQRIKYPWTILNPGKQAEQDCNPCTGTGT